MLKMKKNNAQLKIPESTLIQVINQERATISYNRHKASLEKDLEDRRRNDRERIRMDKLLKIKVFL